MGGGVLELVGFFTKNPYLKKKLFLFLVGGGGARVSEFFFTKNPNLKYVFFCRGGWGGGGGRV